MPITFVSCVLASLAISGIPPLNGFVSKWLIYRSLILDGSPMLFLAAVIGTLGTILSVYKLIHNMFLGQLRIEHEKLDEAPWSMMFPMMILSEDPFFSGSRRWCCLYLPVLALDPAPSAFDHARILSWLAC